MEFLEINLGHEQPGEVILDYKKDITYSSEGDGKLVLHVIYPVANKTGEKRHYPVVLYFMANYDYKQEYYHNMPRLAQFSQRGYAVGVMEMPAGHASYETQSRLIKDAVDTLEQYKNDLNLDVENIFILRDGCEEQEENRIDTNAICFEPFSSKFRAIICFGGQQSIKNIYEKLKDSMPPVLMIPCNSRENSKLDFWTEEVFDYVEDFMSNYIR